jgi:hypothetical protein
MREALGLARREALWGIKALRDEPLERFAAATEREQRTIAEIVEPQAPLRPMTSGSEIVEDYRHVGQSLRRHTSYANHRCKIIMISRTHLARLETEGKFSIRVQLGENRVGWLSPRLNRGWLRGLRADVFKASFCLCALRLNWWE